MKKTQVRRVVDKLATKVSTKVGGADLVDYLGTRIAQRKNKSIQQTTSGKKALKSAAKVAGNIALLASGAVASRMAAKAAARKAFTMPGQMKKVKIKYGGKGKTIGGRKTWDEGGW